jgi:hypothetical protein
MRKNESFEFGQSQITAQEDLKQALLESPAIRPLDHTSGAPVILSVDTSYIAVGLQQSTRYSIETDSVFDGIYGIRYTYLITCISSLSFCFFGLVQAQKSPKKPESDKQDKLSSYYEKASNFGPRKSQNKL